MFINLKNKFKQKKAEKALEKAIKNSCIEDIIQYVKSYDNTPNITSKAVNALLSFKNNNLINTKLFEDLNYYDSFFHNPRDFLRIFESTYEENVGVQLFQLLNEGKFQLISAEHSVADFLASHYDKNKVIEYLLKRLLNSKNNADYVTMLKEQNFNFKKNKKSIEQFVYDSAKKITKENSTSENIVILSNICAMVYRLNDASLMKWIILMLKDKLDKMVINSANQSDFASGISYLGVEGIKILIEVLVKEVMETDPINAEYFLNDYFFVSCAYPILLKNILQFEVSKKYGCVDEAKNGLIEFNNALRQKLTERIRMLPHSKTGFICSKCGKPIYKELLVCPHCGINLLS